MPHGAFERAVELVRGYKRDLDRNRAVVRAIRRELAKRAYETWAEVEAASGMRVVTTTGGLDLWPRDAIIPMEDYTGSLAAEGVEFETLDGAEVGGAEGGQCPAHLADGRAGSGDDVRTSHGVPLEDVDDRWRSGPDRNGALLPRGN